MKMKMKIILCLLAIFISFTLVGCSSKKDKVLDNNTSAPKVDIKTDGEVYQDNMPGNEDDIIKNLDIKFEKALDDTYVMFIKNNNTFVIPDIEIGVNFKKNGSIVSHDKDGHDVVLPGYTVVSTFESFESFDAAEYDITVEWDNSYKNHSAKLSVDYNLNSSKDCLVTVTNSYEDKIDEVEIIAVFYDKDGKLLGTSHAEDIIDLRSGKSETLQLYLSKYSLKEKIVKAEVYVNQAHTFGL